MKLRHGKGRKSARSANKPNITNRFELVRCEACGRRVKRKSRQQLYCSDRCREWSKGQRRVRKAMSPYARVVYYALKSRYGHKIRNNGRIYLSARAGAEETGFSKNAITRALRELQHYGFIVMTKASCLGVEGKGVAPHWRLTELGYMHESPTRDFLKWNGEMFHEQKSPAYYKRQDRCIAKLRGEQKQNPVPINGTECPDQRYIPVSLGAVHINESACPSDRYISRVNHYAVPDAPLVPAGATPDVSGLEISPNTWVDDWSGLPPDQPTIDAYIAAWENSALARL